MKRSHLSISKLTCALLVLPGLLCATVEAADMSGLPIHSESLKKAVSAENLKALADKTQDAELLLGLSYLAPADHPLRNELSERIAKLKPEYAPAAAVLAVLMDGANEANVARLIELDPNNALGHYLRANLLYKGGQDAAALDAFRDAAKRRELRVYESLTSAALLKALGALDLQGRDRLYALSWVATRLFNSGVAYIQPLHTSLGELARKGDLQRREEISDMLLVLAGHLYRTNYNFRTYGERALPVAFRLKAEVSAAEDSPRMYGYAAATQALFSTMHSWPEITDGNDLQRVVPFVAGRIYGAFALVDPQVERSQREKVELSAEAQKQYEQARQKQIEAAEALIEAAMKDPDEIVGAYLKPVMPRDEKANEPWVSRHTYVERAMSKHPAVFKAALRHEEAMDAVYAAGSSDPRQQNISRMMQVAEAIIGYAFEHEHRLPESLDLLVKEKYLEPGEARSLITGRPYVYVGAGQKLPEKQSERFGFIVLYDDHEADGRHQAALAIPGGFELGAAELQKRLEAQRR